MKLGALATLYFYNFDGYERFHCILKNTVFFKRTPSNYIYTWWEALSNKQLVLMFGVVKGFIEVSAISDGAANPKLTQLFISTQQTF